MSNEHTNEPTTGIEIAIIGMAGRFPGAADVEAFWRNIRDGVESATAFSDEALRAQGVPDRDLDDPAYVKAGVPFEGMDQFDAGFFGYTPREAEQMDPQQRVFLECAWEALEHAGHAVPEVPVGLYAGEGPNVYLMRHLLPAFGPEAQGRIADLLGLMSGNSPGSLCTRVAYKLNLRGPAIAVQTACSTSLVAVHIACQALLGHDCDMALAGGVWLNLLQEGGYRHQAGAILSPDGHCRAFDARAAGTLIGSGAGIVVLKRLDDALRDGDMVHAVIKGSAANNDGAGKIGYTAPSIDGQAQVIRAAQLVADVPPDSIGYVEAHGTGTTLGDPIEVAALTQAFRHGTQRRGYCALGSVKTNIGHLDAAAGVAGLIKTVMALKHRTLPPSLHFEQPNPQIDFAASPFYVNTQARPWPEGRLPRRAGVSAFGIGGTNVHVVLEEALPPAQADHGGWQVLPVSARDDTALRQSCGHLAAHLRDGMNAEPAQALADAAHTLQAGRQAFAHRCAVVADQPALAAQALEAATGRAAPAQAPDVVFLFPGGGTQHAHMGAALYRHSATFRGQVDTCCGLLKQETGFDLIEDLFPTPGQEAAANQRLSGMERAQPALFIVEYAMARWWMQAGVQPALMLGHSLGEYVAACLAGVFRLEDALRIVATRGRLMQTLAPGAMSAVPLAEAELAPFLAGCDVAAVNGEQLCVLAGPVPAIEQAEAALRERGHLPRRLHVAVASHSSLVEPIMAELERVVASVPRQAPQRPFISSVTGLPITAEQATSPAYWARHLRSTVRFADGLGDVLGTPGRVLLEVGPGETLAGLARQHPRAATAGGIWASQAHPQQHARNAQHLAGTLAGLWMAGVALDWNACAAGQPRRRVPLPTYPFQRRRYWVDMGVNMAQAPGDGFHVPRWERRSLPQGPAAEAGRVLVLGDAGGMTSALVRQLRQRGDAVVLALRGPGYASKGEQPYEVRPAERADHEALLRAAEADGPLSSIYHLWSLDDDALDAGFFSLLALAQALDAGPRPPLALTVVTRHVEDVSGIEPLCPEKATLLGMARVIGQEYPHIACRVVDLRHEGSAEDAQARRLVDEAGRGGTEFVVAHRGAQRWIKTYPELPREPTPPQRLRSGGVYLITGGLGGVGLALARHLARRWQARLVLLGRTPVPPRTAWEAGAVDPGQPALARRRLVQLLELEAMGAQVLTLSADVTDPAQMAAALERVHAHFGPVHGVIHAVVQPGRGMIAQRTRAQAEAAFAPKIAGTRVLLQAVRDEPLDFVLLCSSIASLIGGLGRSDYAAANAYLDALAQAHRQSSGRPLISVNWDAWRDVGIALDMAVPEGMGLDEATGVQAFERIVNGPELAQVVVSSGPFDARANALQSLPALPPAAPVRSGHPRPVLQTPYTAPDGALEEAIAALWTDLLGIAPIGVHDNLFELGGDSLLAIRLLAQVRQAYSVELHPAAFFRAPTVAELAAAVEHRLIDELETTPIA